MGTLLDHFLEVPLKYAGAASDGVNKPERGSIKRKSDHWVVAIYYAGPDLVNEDDMLGAMSHI